MRNLLEEQEGWKWGLKTYRETLRVHKALDKELRADKQVTEAFAKSLN